jgi:hypothetical protein
MKMTRELAGQPLAHAIGYELSEDNDFSVEKAISHVARKANFKSRGEGAFVKMGWWSRVKGRIEGSNADGRYHRAAYESSQRLSVSLCAEEHKARTQAAPVDTLRQSNRIKSRFFTQDNLRFRPEYTNKEYGLCPGDKRTVRCAAWARRLNGLTELGAAPTGLLLKIGKILFSPHASDKAGRNQGRVFLTLPCIAYMVSGVSSLLFALPGKKIFEKVKDAIREDIIALAGCFSAVAAMTSLASLISAAVGTMSAVKADLSDVVMNRLGAERDKHFNRLFLLLKNAENKAGAEALLAKALNKKISAAYRNESGVPVLLERLLQAFKSGGSKADVIESMKTVVGSYSTEQSIHGDTPNVFLSEGADKHELLKRENHCVALTNLIEHVSINPDPQEIYKDARHGVEDAVSSVRQRAMKAAGWAAGCVGWKGLKQTLNANASDQAAAAYLSKRSDPLNTRARRFSTENMIENRHQYGPLTRALIGTAEVLRLVNHSVLLSMNYQLTRPVAWLNGRFMEGVLSQPNSRTASFSVGRFVSSCAWATMEALLFVSLAGGKGIGLEGPEVAVKRPFPWAKINAGPVTMSIGVTSTAAQMFLLALPITAILLVAKATARLEGWAGDVVKPLPKAQEGREMLQWC